MNNDIFATLMTGFLTNATLTADTNGTALDTRTGYGDGYVNVRVDVGTITGGGSMALTLAESDDNSTFTALATNSAFTNGPTATLNAAGTYYLHGLRSKRYVRAQYVETGTFSAAVTAFYAERKVRSQP